MNLIHNYNMSFRTYKFASKVNELLELVIIGMFASKTHHLGKDALYSKLHIITFYDL
jgi:hypothetical protein